MATEPTFTNTDRAASMSSGAHDTGLYDPNRHDNQIVAMYDTVAQANAARDQLIDAGVPLSSIQVVDQDASGTAGVTRKDAPDEGIWGSIKSLFVPDEDAHGYAEGVRRGHAVLSVNPSGQADRSHIIEVLERTDPIDFDAKLAEWRQSGYSYPNAETVGAAAGMAAAPMAGTSTSDRASTTAPGATASDLTAADRARTATPRTDANRDTTLGDNETIKVMEERLRVGKREVAQGAVRVRSYVVERPVEEQVHLHDERVTLERHPVDRAVTAADDAAFRERTIEVRATGEEAVVSKEARVIEEIGIRKEATDRVETVRDTVRRTEVEVDDTASNPNTRPSTGAAPSGTSSTGTSATGTSATGGKTTTSTTGATTSGTNAPRK